MLYACIARLTEYKFPVFFRLRRLDPRQAAEQATVCTSHDDRICINVVGFIRQRMAVIFTRDDVVFSAIRRSTPNSRVHQIIPVLESLDGLR